MLALSSPYVKIGHIQLTIDDDSIVRRVYLKAGYNAPHWPIMPLAALQALHPDEPRYFDENLPGIRTDREAYGEWLQDYEVMIPFYGPRDSFTTVSASQVLQGEVPASTFDDKIVFVGIASDGLEDMVPTPVSSLNRAMPGVEIHVNLFASIRDGLLVTPVNRDWNYIVALLVLPLLMLTYSRAGPEWSLAAALVASCGIHPCPLRCRS